MGYLTKKNGPVYVQFLKTGKNPYLASTVGVNVPHPHVSAS